MNLVQRYRMLTFWNRVGFWGSIASLLGIAITVWQFSVPSNGTSAAPVAALVNINQGITEDQYLKLAEKYGITKRAVQTFFGIVDRREIPEAQLEAALADYAFELTHADEEKRKLLEKVTQNPREVLKTARDLISKHYRLPKMTVLITRLEAEYQSKTFVNDISLMEALRASMDCFLTSEENAESPLNIVESKVENVESKDQARRILRERLNRKSTTLVLMPFSKAAEGFDLQQQAELWVFGLEIPELSDHLYWAYTDRRRPASTSCYGFN